MLYSARIRHVLQRSRAKARQGKFSRYNIRSFSGIHSRRASHKVRQINFNRAGFMQTHIMYLFRMLLLLLSCTECNWFINGLWSESVGSLVGAGFSWIELKSVERGSNRLGIIRCTICMIKEYENNAREGEYIRSSFFRCCMLFRGWGIIAYL